MGDTYRATRVSLMRFEIKDHNGVVIGSIALKSGIWPTEGAPLGNAVPRSLTNQPEIEVGGIHYTAHRKLLTNKVFNDFRICLRDDAGSEVICGELKAHSWSVAIGLTEPGLVLRRHGLFKFAFSLGHADGGTVARFRDVSPFWTFGSRREYELVPGPAVGPLPLVFAFFLATSFMY